MEHKEKTGIKIGKVLLAILIMGSIGFFGVFIAKLHGNMEEKTQYRNQGIIDYNNKDYESAIKDFQASLDYSALFSEPLDRDTRLYLADSLLLSKQYEEAIIQYDILLKTEEEQIAYLQLQKQIAQGFLDFQNQEYEAALPAFQAAIDAGHTECMLYAGVCAVELGYKEEIVAYLTSYLSYDPDNAYACTQLADYYLHEQLMDTCYQYLQRGLNQPDRSYDEQLLFIEIVYYEYQKDYNKAYELICKYMQTYPVTETVQREYDFLATRQTLE